MSLLLGPEADTTNGSDAPAPRAAKPKRPSQADALLGVMDEDEAAEESPEASARAADVMPPEDEAAAEDQHTTGEEPAATTLPGASLEEQTDEHESADLGMRNAESEAESEAEPGDDERGELPRGVRRKLARQSERIERLEEELEAERAKAAEASRRPDEPGAGPVSITDAEHKLDREIDGLRTRRGKISEALRLAAQTGADRVTVKLDPNGEAIEVSAAEAEDALEALGDRMAERKDDLRGLRRERESVKTRVEEILRARHPWTSDRKNAATAAIETLLRRYPALQQIPEARYWIASTMAYEYLTAKGRETNGESREPKPSSLDARPSTNGRPAPPPPRPPPPSARATRPAASPLAVNGTRAQLGAIQAKFAKSGDDQAGKELLGHLLTS